MANYLEHESLSVDSYLPVTTVAMLVLLNHEKRCSKQNQFFITERKTIKKTYVFNSEMKKLNSKRFSKNQLLRKS